MFLVYLGGKLLFAEPTFAHFQNTRVFMDETIVACRKKAKKGDFLPEDFRCDVMYSK